MTEQEARREFSDVVPFKLPEEAGGGPTTDAARFVDEEAGIVIYGVRYESYQEGGISLTSVPLDQTRLEQEDAE